MFRIIYVALLNEGLNVWRPVSAELISTGTYKIVGTVPDGEIWKFQPGDVVICRTQEISGEKELVANEKLE